MNNSVSNVVDQFQHGSFPPLVLVGCIGFSYNTIISQIACTRQRLLGGGSLLRADFPTLMNLQKNIYKIPCEIFGIDTDNKYRELAVSHIMI